MAKSPAFQFYAADFLTDTAEMTDQEVGVYMRLLCHQWVNGSLNREPHRLANGVAIGVLEVWDEIKHKFVEGEDGRLRNPKMEEVRSKQAQFREKCTTAGRRGAAKRWGGGEPHSEPHQNPNRDNVALQSSSSNNKSSPRKFSDEDMGVAKTIFEKILELNPKKKPPNMDSWADTVRLMRERDSRTHEDILKVFTWANNDSFWKVNILSPEKLREKFDDLTIKMQVKPTQSTGLKLPYSDDELWPWAKQHGFSGPGSLTYQQYRQKLKREIERQAA